MAGTIDDETLKKHVHKAAVDALKTIQFPEYISGTKIMHTCCMCGFRGFWTDRWEWFGSLKDEDDGNVKIKVCSSQCKSDYLANKALS
jgi:hypothetical protein